jgi:DNA primase
MVALTEVADDQDLLREVVAFYQRKLLEAPDALAWAEKHAITSEAIERFSLGLSDRTLGLTLPQSDRKAGAAVRERLQRVGILRPSGHEHFVGAMVVPVFDDHGAVVQVYGRLIGASLRSGTKRDLYLPGPMKGVWNQDGLRDREVILCTGLIDALTVWSAGFPNVTTSFGAEHLREHVIPVLKKNQVHVAVLAFPADEHGGRAADDAREVLAAAGIGSTRDILPAGQDVNTFARRRGAAALVEALRGVKRGQAPQPVTPAAEPAVHVLAPERPRSTATVLEATAVSAAAPGTTAPSAAVEPQPPVAAPEMPTEVTEQEVIIRLGERRYRMRGLARNLSYDTLRVNLLVTPDAEPAGSDLRFHADTLDLYSARQRTAFVKQAALELGLREDAVKKDLGRLLLRLEEMQEEQIRKALEPKRKAMVMSDADRNAALDLLRDPHLVDRILSDFDRAGVVGEETNKLVAYLAAVSRKLDDPLAVIIQSSSAAGKTSLMEAVLAFVPDEDRLHFAAMTGQSLFYMGEQDLRHRILAIAEEEGAERASYALKLLQSEGELTIASTGKDPNTGRLVAQEYRVQGPVMLFLTTTAIDLDEELLNRCVVLTVDEDREQTRAIHRLQRERQTLAGLLARRDRERVWKLHRDAQRLLRPLLVANPYAPVLTFLDDQTRTRRDHTKYLTLIRAIALLHQHQREVKAIEHAGQRVEYIEVTLDDIALANKLAHQVLGRSLDDVPPHTRRLLVLLHEMVAASCAAQNMDRSGYRFTRKTVRDATGWGDTQLKVHLQRLVELEHLLVHGGRGQHQYELVYDGQGQGGERFLAGLIDAEKLRRSVVEAVRSGSGRPSVGPWSVGGRPQVGAGEG